MIVLVRSGGHVLFLESHALRGQMVPGDCSDTVMEMPRERPMIRGEASCGCKKTDHGLRRVDHATKAFSRPADSERGSVVRPRPRPLGTRGESTVGFYTGLHAQTM